jgi:hypothetical protein
VSKGTEKVHEDISMASILVPGKGGSWLLPSWNLLHLLSAARQTRGELLPVLADSLPPGLHLLFTIQVMATQTQPWQDSLSHELVESLGHSHGTQWSRLKSWHLMSTRYLSLTELPELSFSSWKGHKNGTKIQRLRAEGQMLSWKHLINLQRTKIFIIVAQVFSTLHSILIANHFWDFCFSQENVLEKLSE